MNIIEQNSPPSNVDRLFERAIIDVGIPPCPAILNRFMGEAKKDEPDYKRLAAIIGTDVGLSAGLIKTANSPFFGVRQRVRSTNEALAMLGLDASSHAVAGIILRKSFPNVPNLERFWDASARIALLSGWLVRKIGIPNLKAEDAYTYGLFRDCGIPVLMRRFPNYGKILESANTDVACNFTEVEEASLPTNHAMIGCLLAQSWWLPEEICLAIRNHHNLQELQSEEFSLPAMSRRLIAVAQLAEHIVQHQFSLSYTEEWPKLGAACLQILGVNAVEVESLYVEAAAIAIIAD